MSKVFRYPRTRSELSKLLYSLDQKIQIISQENNSKIYSREWLRMCRDVNDLRSEAKKLHKESFDENKTAKENLSIVKTAITCLDVNFHQYILSSLEKWMKVKKIPMW